MVVIILRPSPLKAAVHLTSQTQWEFRKDDLRIQISKVTWTACKAAWLWIQQQKGSPMPPPPPPPPTRRLSHFLWFVTYSSGGIASRICVTGELSSWGSSPGVTLLVLAGFTATSLPVEFCSNLATPSHWRMESNSSRYLFRRRKWVQRKKRK